MPRRTTWVEMRKECEHIVAVHDVLHVVPETRNIDFYAFAFEHLDDFGLYVVGVDFDVTLHSGV